MWKLGALFIIVTIGAAHSQGILVECDYLDFGNLYICSLLNITVVDPSANVTFTGAHAVNRTDADVNYVGIANSNTPFIIPQLFTQFPNLSGLDIVFSNLQTLIIPPEVQLDELALFGNNITRIESNSLRNQTRLRQLFASENGITTIDEGAFADLHTIETLILTGNRIEQVHPRLLANMSEILQIYFDGNLITTIEEDTFSQNPALMFVFLAGNRIDRIHPGTLSKLRNNLAYIDVVGNECINRSFSVYPEGDLEWMTMHNLLQPCFNKYLGNDSGFRNVTLQISGPLRIYDSFGNMIASI